MTQTSFFGAGVLGISTVAVIWSILAGSIPAKWPATEITREDNPDAYWAFMGLYGLGVVAGLIMLVRGLR